MGKLFYGGATLVIGAIVAHLAIVLLLPLTAPGTAARQLADILPEASATPSDLSALQEDGLIDLHLDPAFRIIGCRYDVSDAPMRISGSGRIDFWSVSVLDSFGVSIFSANNRISPTPGVDLAVLSAQQLRSFRQSPDPRLENTIVVPSDDLTGFVVVRLFEPDSSWTALVDNFISATSCEPVSNFGNLS